MRCGFADRIRQFFENRFGSVRPVFKQDRQSVQQRPVPEVVGASVTLTAVEKCGQLDHEVASFDELKIEQMRVAAHGVSVHLRGHRVNREGVRIGENESRENPTDPGLRDCRRQCDGDDRVGDVGPQS